MEPSNEEAIEFEGVVFSDAEESSSQAIDDSKLLINIDYNNRIATLDSSLSVAGDNCDTHFFDNSGTSSTKKPEGETSSEEFDLSGEDELYSAIDNIQEIDFEGITRDWGKHHLESSSSFDHSSTAHEGECSTDAECISDEEINFEMNKIVNGHASLTKDEKHRRLSFGLTVADLASTVKDVFSSKQTSLAALNITNPFATNIEVQNKSLPMSSQENSLMTCLEFLASNPTEDELTDVEDFSPDVCNSSSFNTTFDVEEAFRYRGKGGSQAHKDVNKKNSWTVEMLSDDENSTSDTKQVFEGKTNLNTRNMKRNSHTKDCNDQPLTDEEYIDINSSEWTETDDSGSVRQITQIKTETSIKLEGDGDGSAFDSDDLVSRATTTTTTRIVTTVTTDHEEDGNDEQEGEGEDLRHSVEVILNQFMSDGDSSKPDGDHQRQEE